MKTSAADPSLFVKTTVKPSPIFGRGVFAAEPVKKGTVICFFSLPGEVISEDEFVAHVEQGTPMVVRTGTRYVGRHFVWCDRETHINYFNHSFEPNALVHCGICFALRDIVEGEEMTVDYRYLVDSTDIGLYSDAISGREIRGFSARQTLLETSRRLVQLLEGLPDDWDGGSNDECRMMNAE